MYGLQGYIMEYYYNYIEHMQVLIFEAGTPRVQNYKYQYMSIKNVKWTEHYKLVNVKRIFGSEY